MHNDSETLDIKDLEIKFKEQYKEETKRPSLMNKEYALSNAKKRTKSIFKNMRIKDVINKGRKHEKKNKESHDEDASKVQRQSSNEPSDRVYAKKFNLPEKRPVYSISKESITLKPVKQKEKLEIEALKKQIEAQVRLELQEEMRIQLEKEKKDTNKLTTNNVKTETTSLSKQEKPKIENKPSTVTKEEPEVLEDSERPPENIPEIQPEEDSIMEIDDVQISKSKPKQLDRSDMSDVNEEKSLIEKINKVPSLNEKQSSRRESNNRAEQIGSAVVNVSLNRFRVDKSRNYKNLKVLFKPLGAIKTYQQQVKGQPFENKILNNTMKSWNKQASQLIKDISWPTYFEVSAEDVSSSILTFIDEINKKEDCKLLTRLYKHD